MVWFQKRRSKWCSKKRVNYRDINTLQKKGYTRGGAHFLICSLGVVWPSWWLHRVYSIGLMGFCMGHSIGFMVQCRGKRVTGSTLGGTQGGAQGYGVLHASQFRPHGSVPLKQRNYRREGPNSSQSRALCSLAVASFIIQYKTKS